MKNFQVEDKETGKKYWISRSMATCVIPIVYTGSEPTHVLASKRGTGAANHIGKWNFVCGYLDGDETLKECASRELREETSLNVAPHCFLLWKIIDDPKRDERQNVTFRYIISMEYTDINYYLEANKDNLTDTVSRGGEPNEVEEVKLIALDEVDNYEWAFNHRELIKELVEYLNQELDEFDLED